jgi:Lrp/AsnC family leucine-responsive transcriptional regulator
MADYEGFTRRHFFDEANIAKFRTNVVMKRVKSGLTIPLASPEAP